ncbi:MAG: helix-turn-helix domain-containing protein [Proteobacteria bacterium]|nr:helix-turn-helix domain-containing protein [Pseudomonadota bacterium]
MTQENSNKKHSANAEKSDADTSLSLGAYFQRERQKKQLTIKEVADITRIPPETLQALEAGHRHLLPVSVFTKGFVKIYAAHLGLNQAEILERFSNEWGAVENITPEILSGESMAETSPFFLSFQFYFIIFLIALIVGLAYFFFQADDTPPPASLSSVPYSMDQPGEQLTVKRNSVKQLEIISTAPSQENLLISPQSAGKIILPENESPQNPPLAQATGESTDNALQQTPPTFENTAEAYDSVKIPVQTASVVAPQSQALKKKRLRNAEAQTIFF